MIIWGSGGETKDLGGAGARRCDSCGQDRPFKLFLEYRYAHIWYMFQWVTQKKYVCACEVCRRGAILDTAKVEASLAKNPIPFEKRFSWTILVGLIVLVMVAGGIGVHHQNELDRKYLEEPHIDDLYLTDISELLKNPVRSPMYGIMKIKKISGDHVEFQLSSIGYSKSTGPTRDITDKKADDAGYYASEVLDIPISELRSMYEKRIISEIRRK